MAQTYNPLFPDEPKPDDQSDTSGGYLLPDKSNRIEPLSAQDESSTAQSGANPAAALVKEKLARLYDEFEPNAEREAEEAQASVVRSPHQQFMYELTTSGKSLADIQTEWHNYYTNLPDDQKHQVWQEFYDANANTHFYQLPSKPQSTQQPQGQKGEVIVADHTPQLPAAPHRARITRQGVRHKVAERAALLGKQHKQNFHSLLFGLATGAVVLFIFMFGFFNEVIIAPFIQPGRASSAPIIVDSSSIATDKGPEVIIPKINLELPVVYNVSSIVERDILKGLHYGVVHYPTTEYPGQKGNAAFFGHSSSNILSTGRYKFAFVLLHKLRVDDTFYLTYNSKVYAYKVIMRKVVSPNQVSVLNDVPGQVATATLITCDPPGTSSHRLVVVGKQISPDPTNNAASTVKDTSASQVKTINGNGPTMWSRFWHWLF